MDGGWATIDLWQPSPLDWCEPNYAVNAAIAEYWNTVSNLVFPMAQLWALVLHFRLGLERRFLLLEFCAFLIGPGSALFHGTLTFGGQMADEVAMMLTITMWLFCVSTIRVARGSSLERVLMALCGAGITLWLWFAPYVHFHMNGLFQAVFAALVIANVLQLARVVAALDDPACNHALRWYAGTALFGSVLWLLDLHACHFLHSTGLYAFKFGSLHGYWHVFIGLSVIVGPALLKRLHSLHLQEKERIELGRVPLLQMPYLSRRVSIKQL